MFVCYYEEYAFKGREVILILRFENLFNLLRWNAANVSWIALLGTTFDIYLYQFNIQHLLSQI